METYADKAAACAVSAFPTPVRRLAGLIVLAVFDLFLLSGCATTKMDRLMPHVETMQLARHYFGEPTSKSVLPSGETRNEWLLDKVTQVPGQYVEKKILAGYDRDGFPVYYIRNVFVPSHQERQRCRLEILSDREGRVLQSSWEGDGCEAMMVVPTTY